MDSMIDLLVLGVSGIIASSQLPPFHHATHAAHHVGQHVCIAFYAHLPCRHAELQRSAPTSTCGVAWTESRPFQPFRWWKWAYSLPKMIAPQAPQRITCQGGILHVSVTSYIYIYVHTSLLTFTIIPFVLSIQKGKQHWKNLSASLPGFSQLWTALPRKTTLLRSCCKRISLQGKTQKHGPFHWIPMAFSCCLAVYFSRLSCRELSETPLS